MIPSSKRVEYPELIQDLVHHLRRLPGVGPRSAERMALWLQKEDEAFSRSFSETIIRARREVEPCEHCGFFATAEGCALCLDPMRDRRTLCVVEQTLDVIALEKTGAFHGSYFVLGGKLSPLRHIGPQDLRIHLLLRRLKRDECEELILALSNDVEGEATANYVADAVAEYRLKVTKLAQGLPAGGGLENADELTLFRAFHGRRGVDQYP